MRTTRLPLALLACLSAACVTNSDDNIDTQESDLKCLPAMCGNPPPPNTCASATGLVTVSPPNINLGQSVTVSWTTNVPKNCEATFTLNGLTVAGSGSQVFTPKADGSYTLMVVDKIVSQASFTVAIPQSVYITGSTIDDRALFLKAIGIDGEHVGLGPDVDLDLSGRESIPIGRNVTISGEMPIFQRLDFFTLPGPITIGNVPMVPARDARSLGPRVHTSTRPSPLFIADCRHRDSDPPDSTPPANIRIENFRIEGPDMDTIDGDDKLEHGINLESCVNVDIGNMELSGWSGAAIYIADAERREMGPQDILIHDSYIHNNQHVGKDGYGIDHTTYAWSKIEHNVFDNNRHSITAYGQPGNGYWADENLVLFGGGHHDTIGKEYIQVFDVHGDDNCGPHSSAWNCGNAGTQHWFLNNAFQFTHDVSIGIRGTPTIGDVISGNVFTQGSQDDAIMLKQGETNISIFDNTYGVNTFGEYGVCDIDGDGKDDLFLATGASFWFKSAGKMQWTFLSNFTERLKDVRLGDFDGDHRCDVLAIDHGTNQFEIAKGGSGPWTPIPGYTSDITMDQLAVGDFDGDKVSDIFRRDGNGQWWAISPNRWTWKPLQSSDVPLDHLRFGDFDGDGVTDVLGSSGGQWSISWGALSTWQPAGSGLNDDLSRVYVGNVDGVPGDDVIRYQYTGAGYGQWDVSSGARTGWAKLASVTLPVDGSNDDLDLRQPAAYAKTFLGHFSGGTTTDLLVVDPYRWGQLSTVANRAFGPWGFYQY